METGKIMKKKVPLLIRIIRRLKGIKFGDVEFSTAKQKPKLKKTITEADILPKRMTNDDAKILDICAGYLTSLFDSANNKVCSNCPTAKCLKCKTIKDAEKKGEIYSKEAGCCSKCAKENGYFRNYYCYNENIKKADTIRKRKLNKYKKLYKFDEKYGFFNNKLKRCNIPRILRSRTCLEHCCDDIRKELFGNKHSYSIIYKIVEIMDVIRTNYKMLR